MYYKALILAAGLGTRLKPYTNVTPKPMFTLCGKPLLHHWINRLAKAGCSEIFINTHHLHTQIEAYVACNDWPVPVQTLYEPEILGTGGALKNLAAHWQTGDLMVVNGDVVCDFDLAELPRFHQSEQNDVSLLVTDCPQFNTVSTDAQGNVTGFAAKGRPNSLTFTGIQFLAPAVLDYIPAEGFYHSIDAYSAMIADGRKVKALTCCKSWQDLGDIQRYRTAALDTAAQKTFGKTFNDNGAINVEMLSGDGSDRIWRRLTTAAGNSAVVADHGLTAPEDFGKTSEAEAFVNIGKHLNAKGLPVAQIYFHDTFAGLVFTEDLGDLNLQTYVQNEPDKKRVIEMYIRIINAVITCSREGIKGFELDWAWQTKSYDRELILQNECAYFTTRFLQECLGIDTSAFNLKPEFEYLADKIAQHSLWGLMHRDLQSRNIFIKNDRPYFLDYQGARLGPIQYDLASLLYDPYVMLDETTRNLLLNYCCEHDELASQHDKLEKGFYYCALSRTMQALGAYAFLSAVKNKPWFKQYMAPALTNLNSLLKHQRFAVKFAALKQAAALAAVKLEKLS